MNDEPLTKPFSRLDSRVTLVLFVLDRMFTLDYELVPRNARAVLIMSSPLRIA